MQLQRVSTVAARYFGRPVPPLGPLASPSNNNGGSLSVAPASTNSGGEIPPGHNPVGASLVPSGGPSGGGLAGLLNPVPTDHVVLGPSVAEVALVPGGLAELEKPIVVELAVSALKELLRMFHSEAPLWMKAGIDGATDVLNTDEYFRQFSSEGIGPRPLGLRTEASRDTGLVIMNGATLVEALMDAVRLKNNINQNH